jgi:hypothetical protein
MKIKSWLPFFVAFGMIGGPLSSTLSAEVTMDQVREEVDRQMKANPPDPSTGTPTPIDQSKIDFKSGKGIPLVRSPNGELKMNLYLLVRYLNQLPATQSFEDHLGNSHDIDTANYISAPHRVIMNFNGWVYDPRFLYSAAKVFTFFQVQCLDNQS